MDVQVMSRKLIKPSKPTPSHLRHLSISFLDQIIPPRYAPIIFYYLTTDIERVHLLEKSLAETLTLYYPLAGRYDKDRYLIDCNDKGVEYSEVLIKGRLLAQILREDVDPKELNPFVPDEIEESIVSPLLAIQVSHFDCGGISIGIRMSHRILDAPTFLDFTNGWAKASKLGISYVQTPKFVANVSFPSRELPSSLLPAICQSKNNQVVVTKRVVFDLKKIEMLRDEQVKNFNSRPSIVEILMALTWKTHINAARAKHRSSSLLVIVGMRRKMVKNIPEDWSGNLWTRIPITFDDDQHEKASKVSYNLDEVIFKVMSSMRKCLLEYKKQDQSGGDKDEFLSNVIVKPVVKARTFCGDICVFSGLRHMPFYEVDFGWGKPIWVSFAEMYEGVMVLDARDLDGIEAWVSMKEDEMRCFLTDPDVIMAMKPSFLCPKL